MFSFQAEDAVFQVGWCACVCECMFLCVWRYYVNMIAFVCERMFFLCVWVRVNMFWDRVSQSNLELPSLSSELAPVSVSHPCLHRCKLQADQPAFMWAREGHNHWIKVQIIDVFVWTDLLSFVLSSRVLRAKQLPCCGEPCSPEDVGAHSLSCLRLALMRGRKMPMKYGHVSDAPFPRIGDVIRSYVQSQISN